MSLMNTEYFECLFMCFWWVLYHLCKKSIHAFCLFFNQVVFGYWKFPFLILEMRWLLDIWFANIFFLLCMFYTFLIASLMAQNYNFYMNIYTILYDYMYIIQFYIITFIWIYIQFLLLLFAFWYYILKNPLANQMSLLCFHLRNIFGRCFISLILVVDLFSLNICISYDIWIYSVNSNIVLYVSWHSEVMVQVIRNILFLSNTFDISVENQLIIDVWVYF